ncbi:MAG: 50S ribosomal protein L11 methyltransferase [Verrucomicrobia bacterium]|nr:50S ribosomal protein L11 methyltransferase [Verrucomicrobiota bacterium]NBU08073.1 50S ribosomal protein L11 methyltransferase [Pseudomonadota bacterium]NDA65175.1 50S ribosomal protein L11 methyltransferase [Verrucomicrobiota bacterium]NDB74344.1 50S ribosomal protein L11 methyltransferase [Verrucomicrobiota bacterium]NDD37128.1 50S ribosomal protein L11 methyltransferase [Verrucomicrobiota bacterium]
MKSASLTKISIATSREAEEAVAELLLSLFGQTPSTYFDAETGETTVSTYLEKSAQWSAAARAELQAGLRNIDGCGLDIGPGEVSASKVRREDWAESWKRHFKPVEIGDALLLKPSWVKRKARKGQAVVILDPGLSFGTGHHATTGFCLRQLVAVRAGVGLGEKAAAASRPAHNRYLPRNLDLPLSLLDIGTGSGILAIAAAKLGYSPVRCFDFDPESVRVAKANAAQNGVAHLVKPVRHDLTRLPLASATRYHVVCANLIYDLLIAERDRILNRVRSDGVLVLAGILQTQFAKVERAYRRAGWRLVATDVEKEWQSGAFRFHAGR